MMYYDEPSGLPKIFIMKQLYEICLLYTSDAADDMQCVDLGGRRIIKKQIVFIV